MVKSVRFQASHLEKASLLPMGLLFVSLSSLISDPGLAPHGVYVWGIKVCEFEKEDAALSQT